MRNREIDSDRNVSPSQRHETHAIGALRMVRWEWQPRIDSIDFCRRRCIAEEWPEAQQRELNEWEEQTHTLRQVATDEALADFYSPHHGPASVPGYAGLTQRMRLAVREHATMKIQRAAAQWLYRPDGPMTVAHMTRLVGEGMLSEPGLDSDFEEVDHF